LSPVEVTPRVVGWSPSRPRASMANARERVLNSLLSKHSNRKSRTRSSSFASNCRAASVRRIMPRANTADSWTSCEMSFGRLPSASTTALRIRAMSVGSSVTFASAMYDADSVSGYLLLFGSMAQRSAGMRFSLTSFSVARVASVFAADESPTTPRPPLGDTRSR
jgi:hypothetical protein